MARTTKKSAKKKVSKKTAVKTTSAKVAKKNATEATQGTKTTKTTKTHQKTKTTKAQSPTGDERLTLAHVTHEAVEQIGGIGTVLEGLMVSPIYQQKVKRSILIGPMWSHVDASPENRLGEHGKVLYSSIDDIDKNDLGARLRPIEWAFDVRIVYGTRQYDPPGQDRHGEAEVLLIDVFKCNPDRLGVFKHKLWEKFGLDSQAYEQHWDFEEYVRLAQPAYYALQALLGDEDKPCVVFGHEYMGMPACLQVILEGSDDFRTVFHGHECSTARHIVEGHPGHDTMFYNVLDQAREQGLYVEDVFGSLQHHLRHALVSRAHLCDAAIAVGDRTRDEMHFLNEKFSRSHIDVVYNGLPAFTLTAAGKHKSRSMLSDYCEKLVGYTPDIMMTHVTRPVISKGMWRDLNVCHQLDGQFAKKRKTGVLIMLTSAGGVRRPQDIEHMVQDYDWPRNHRYGYPDLVGPEEDLHRMIEAFNAEHKQIQIVLVNQFGWSRQRIGSTLPKNMTIADLRVGTDVEFGMATYEPFGISPLEPLGAGAICVISNVCGCEGFVRHVAGMDAEPNVLSADFTKLDEHWTIEELLAMTEADRNAVEDVESKRIADKLMASLPWDESTRGALIERGQTLVAKMGWDQVVANELLPVLHRISQRPTPDDL